MTRVSLLNSPLLLGFDQFERTLEQIAKIPIEGYPPYNIERTGSNELRITLALAGFSLKDLEIVLEDNQLSIKGQKKEEDQNIYLHRGIANRQFNRNFIIAEGMEVISAIFVNGLLHIDLLQPKPARKTQKIKISEGPEKTKNKTLHVLHNND